MKRVLGLTLLLAATACNSKDAQSPPAGAEGEVLPGSISDAMLPYDTVTSVPPLEAPVDAVRNPGGYPSERAAAGEGGAAPEPEAT